MSTPLQPLSDNVVAQVEEAEKKTASGLYLPDKAAEKPRVAKVLAVGKDVNSLKAGDRIVYKSYSETEIKIGSDEFVIVREKDILATVK